MVFVCPSCGSPDMYNRGFQFHLLLAAGHRHRPGQGVRRMGRSPPRGPAPQDRGLPLARRPVRRPRRRRRRGDPVRRRNRDGLQGRLPGHHEELRLDRQHDQGSRRRHHRPGCAVRRWRELRPLDYCARTSRPTILYQSSSPTYGAQYVEGVGAENAEGVFFSSSYHVAAETPGNAEFVAQVQGDVRRRAARGRRGRFRRRHRARRRRRGGRLDRRPEGAGRLDPLQRGRRRSSARSAGTKTAAPRATSSSASGRTASRRSCSRPTRPRATPSSAGRARRSDRRTQVNP